MAATLSRLLVPLLPSLIAAIHVDAHRSRGKAAPTIKLMDAKLAEINRVSFSSTFLSADTMVVEAQCGALTCSRISTNNEGRGDEFGRWKIG